MVCIFSYIQKTVVFETFNMVLFIVIVFVSNMTLQEFKVLLNCKICSKKQELYNALTVAMDLCQVSLIINLSHYIFTIFCKFYKI